MKLLVGWLVNACALYVTARLVPGILIEGGAGPLFLAALVIGLLNALVRPVLVLLTLPITILTLGLFYLLLNGLLLYLAAALTPGFAITGPGWAVLGAAILSLVGTILHGLVSD